MDQSSNSFLDKGGAKTLLCAGCLQCSICKKLSTVNPQSYRRRGAQSKSKKLVSNDGASISARMYCSTCQRDVEFTVVSCEFTAQFKNTGKGVNVVFSNGHNHSFLQEPAHPSIICLYGLFQLRLLASTLPTIPNPKVISSFFRLHQSCSLLEQNGFMRKHMKIFDSLISDILVNNATKFTSSFHNFSQKFDVQISPLVAETSMDSEVFQEALQNLKDRVHLQQKVDGSQMKVVVFGVQQSPEMFSFWESCGALVFPGAHHTVTELVNMGEKHGQQPIGMILVFDTTYGVLHQDIAKKKQYDPSVTKVAVLRATNVRRESKNNQQNSIEILKAFHKAETILEYCGIWGQIFEAFGS